MNSALFRIDDIRQCTITNVNTRKEKHGPEESVRAMDVNIMAEAVDVERCAILFGASPEVVSAAFWDSSGKVLFPELKPIRVEAEFENKYQLVLEGVEDRAHRVCRFALQPRGGAVLDVSFQVQVSEPIDGLFEKAWDAMGGKAMVKLDPLPDLLDTEND